MTADQSSGPPPWDQQEADKLIGKYALVGITYIAPDGETVRLQLQIHGRIVSADPKAGFAIACEGARAGETWGVPLAPSLFEFAAPGDYHLRSTGEVVSNPDVVAAWSVFENSVAQAE